MQLAHTRMRRAVETENQDIESKKPSRRRNNNNNRLRKRLKPLNLCLVVIVLSPLLVIGALVFAARYYTTWSAEIIQSQGRAETSENAPGEIETTTAELKRLRNGQAVGRQQERRQEQQQKSGRGSDDGDAVAHREDSPQDRIEKGALTETVAEKSESRAADVLGGREFLVLTTEHHGNIRIRLRPDLSPESVEYVHRLVESYGGNGQRCMHCQFYRADKPGILQGIMAHEGVVAVNEVRGRCPDGAETVRNDCPEWDQHCGCHGPVMTRGAVAWAAGEAGGPDFFIDAYPTAAEWWGTQHTNFGSIDDEASLTVIDAIFELPIESTPQMDLLKTPIHFDLALD